MYLPVLPVTMDSLNDFTMKNCIALHQHKNRALGTIRLIAGDLPWSRYTNTSITQLIYASLKEGIYIPAKVKVFCNKKNITGAEAGARASSVHPPLT